MIYLLILLVIIYCTFRYPDLKGRGKYWYYFVCFILIAVAGFRYKVGIDTVRYTEDYEFFPKFQELTDAFVRESKFQFLWIVFESSLRNITSSFYFLQIILATFVNIVVFYTVKKYSVYPFLTILLYYLMFYLNLNMEIMRESVAISIFLLSADLLRARRWVSYYLLAVVAYFFHESAIVLFIFPFIHAVNFTKLNIVVSIALLVVFSGVITFFFIDNISSISFLFNESKLLYFEADEANLKSKIFLFLKYVIFPTFILYFFYGRLTKLERSVIFTFVFMSVFTIQFFIFYRLRDYFLLFFLISFVNAVYKKYDVKWRGSALQLKAIFLSVFLFTFLYRAYYISDSRQRYQIYLNYFPYTSILNEEMPEDRADNIKRVYFNN